MSSPELVRDNPAPALKERPAGDSNVEAGPNKLLEPFLQHGQGTRTNEQQWTVAVDLSILFDVKGPNGHFGAEDKAKMLEQLAEKTKGSGVTIVAQVLSVKDGDKVSSLSESKEPYQVTRIVLKDGNVETGPTVPSKGAQSDFADLMDYAAAQPSAKFAVALNAHGLGDYGIVGGMQEGRHRANGGMTPAQVSEVVSGALQKSGRGKLDVFDYDGCLMSQTGVLDAMSKSTKQLVASELPENVFAHKTGASIDSQNLNAWLSSLLDNPSMDGTQLARTIVDSANRGYNTLVTEKGVIQDGAPSLTKFDLEHHYDEFKTLLNNFGDALSASVADTDSKKMINNDIDRLPDLCDTDGVSAAFSNDLTAKRDLFAFMNTIKLSLGAGLIKDPDKRIANSLDALSTYLSDRTKLITDSHGTQTKYGTNSLGGVSVFLPTLELRTDPNITEKQLDEVYNETGDQNGGWLAFIRSLRQPRPRTLWEH